MLAPNYAGDLLLGMRLTTKIHRENGRQFSIIRLIDVKYSIILDMKKCDMLSRFEKYSLPCDLCAIFLIFFACVN